MASKKKAGKKAAKKAAKTAVKKAVKAQANAKRPVNPVPRGYRTVTPALTQADSSATIAFCKKAFGAQVLSKRVGPGRRIVHAEIQIGDSIVMLGDDIWEPAQPASLWLYVPDVDKTIAKAAKAGGKVRMQPQNMFWGDRMGAVEDPQGNVWSIASRVEVVRPDELKRRMKAEFKKQAAR
jgi:PhnB protein